MKKIALIALLVVAVCVLSLFAAGPIGWVTFQMFDLLDESIWSRWMDYWSPFDWTELP